MLDQQDGEIYQTFRTDFFLLVQLSQEMYQVDTTKPLLCLKSSSMQASENDYALIGPMLRLSTASPRTDTEACVRVAKDIYGRIDLLAAAGVLCSQPTLITTFRSGNN